MVYHLFKLPQVYQIHMRDFPLNALMETRTSLFLTFVRYFAPF